MRPRTRSTDVGPRHGCSYSETIDERSSAIRARGRLDRLAVDLLCGTIEQMHRRGHADITVTIEPPVSVEPCARAALTEFAERLAGRHGRVTVRWADAQGPPSPTTAIRHRRAESAEWNGHRPMGNRVQEG
jgi:hypothetical protein